MGPRKLAGLGDLARQRQAGRGNAVISVTDSCTGEQLADRQDRCQSADWLIGAVLPEPETYGSCNEPGPSAHDLRAPRATT